VDRSLTEFLMEHWAPGARPLTKSIVKSCPACIKAKGPHYALPEMPSLPADRVTRRRPFESVGIDYLGPTLTKASNGVKTKTWILLITCLATRAVFLQPTWSLSAEELWQTLRQFIGRRGRPDRILSDNGTQFRMATRVLDAFHPTCQGIQWRFIGQTLTLAGWGV